MASQSPCEQMWYVAQIRFGGGLDACRKDRGLRERRGKHIETRHDGGGQEYIPISRKTQKRKIEARRESAVRLDAILTFT